MKDEEQKKEEQPAEVQKLLRLRLRPMYSNEELEVYRMKIQSEVYCDYALNHLSNWLGEAVASYYGHNWAQKRSKRKRH